MSSRRTISNTFTVTTMDDPVSVQAQYSPDKTVVHTVWQSGDLYMRTRESDSSAWSSWHKIVGESGDETNYTFALSAYKVSQDGTSSTAPSDISANAWQDAPMATTSQKPYLWSKVQKKDGAGNSIGNPSYIRLTGEDGEDGDSIFQVQAFKYFSGTPSSSDKPTKTTNIWQSTTDFGNGWYNRPTKQAGTGLSSVDYGEVAGWFANGVVTIPSPGDSGINIGTIYFTTSQADVDVEIEITSSSEASYDYGAIGKLDTTSLSGATASSIKSDNGTICSGKVSGDGTTMLVTLSVASAGRHFVQIAYAKDGSQSSFNDNAVVRVVTSVDSPNDLAYCCMATVVNGTVSGSWSSPIPWQGDKGDGAKYIYLRGTGNNNPMPALFTSFDGTTANNVQITSRGLTLLLVNRSDLSIYSQTSYDVYGDGESTGIPQCNALASAINNASSAYFVCIVSFDAVRWNDNLVNALKSCGSGGVEDQTPYRVPFAFIGYKGLGEGYAMQVQSGQGATDAPAEITAYVANGALATTKSGQRGKVGRFFYYAGTFDGSDSTTTFIVSDAQAPYFYYNNNYWVYNPEINPSGGSTTMSAMGTPSSSSDDWEIMTNDFKYLITEAIFGQYAHFGSFIINGDWLLSTNGKVGESVVSGESNISGSVVGGSRFSVKAVTLFDSAYPSDGMVDIAYENNTVTIATSETTKQIMTVYLSASLTYRVSCDYSRSSGGSFYVRIRHASYGSVTPIYLPYTSGSASGDFRVTTSGTYIVEIYAASTGYTASVWNTVVSRLLFAPMYAVDGKTGASFQGGNGVFRGFVRKQKTRITTSNINQYKRTDITSSTVLDFDKCGSFIELATGTYGYITLPLMSNYFASRYTSKQIDDIRSFVGTTMLIYNKSGQNIPMTLRYNSDGSTTSGTLHNGNCVELECCLDADSNDGKEIIYWKVISYAEPVV